MDVSGIAVVKAQYLQTWHTLCDLCSSVFHSCYVIVTLRVRTARFPTVTFSMYSRSSFNNNDVSLGKQRIMYATAATRTYDFVSVDMLLKEGGMQGDSFYVCCFNNAFADVVSEWDFKLYYLDQILHILSFARSTGTYIVADIGVGICVDDAARSLPCPLQVEAAIDTVRQSSQIFSQAMIIVAQGMRQHEGKLVTVPTFVGRHSQIEFSDSTEPPRYLASMLCTPDTLGLAFTAMCLTSVLKQAQRIQAMSCAYGRLANFWRSPAPFSK